MIRYNHSGRGGAQVKYIVIHDTGNPGKGADAQAHYNYFNGGNRGASAHYFVDDKQVIQCVDENRAAWAVGDGRGRKGITNANSISVEVCINTDGDYRQAVDCTITLVADIMRRRKLPIESLARHYDASGKTCPTSMAADNWAKWHELKRKVGALLVQDTQKITLQVHGKPLEVEAVNVDGRNFVPVRVLEEFGYKIEYGNGNIIIEYNTEKA